MNQTAARSAVLDLFVDDGGQRDTLPVVFLHSAGGSHQHFEAQLAHLRSTRRAIAIDLRGHGRSPMATSFAIEDAAADVCRTLATLRIERFVLVGHSWGGAVAVAVLGQIPSHVAGLLLLDPSTDARRMPPEVAQGLMAALRQNYQAVVEQHWSSMLVTAHPDVRERLMREIRSVPQAVVEGTLEALLPFDPVTPLQGYQGPMRSVITALNDRDDAYHRQVAKLPITRIEGTGHWLHLDKPEEVNAVMDEFLKSVNLT